MTSSQAPYRLASLKREESSKAWIVARFPRVAMLITLLVLSDENPFHWAFHRYQDELDNLRFWAKQNPPDGCKVILAGIAKPKSKSASGTEDFVLTLRVEEGQN